MNDPNQPVENPTENQNPPENFRSQFLAITNAKWFLVGVVLFACTVLYAISASSRGLWPFPLPKQEIISTSLPTATFDTPGETFVPLDPRVDWKTYRNEEYGFEVKYPPTWRVSDFPGDARNSAFVEFYNTNKQYKTTLFGKDPNFAEAEIAPIVFMYGKDIYNSSIISYVGPGHAPLIGEEAGFVGRKMAYIVKGESKINGITTNLDYRVVFTNGNFYRLSSQAGAISTSDRNDAVEITAFFNQMLSTFKFIEPTTLDNGGVCIQVITPARNPQTGEVKDFPTPCDVPEGWEVVEN